MLCLFLIRETKCCTCVIVANKVVRIKGGRGHTVSAEPGGTLLVTFAAVVRVGCMNNGGPKIS